jgi:hypothetical protein
MNLNKNLFRFNFLDKISIQRILSIRHPISLAMFCFNHGLQIISISLINSFNLG